MSYLNSGHFVLSSYDPATWIVRQCLIHDWHDGPLEGFCELEYPEYCFYFRAVAVEIDELDDNVYRYEVYYSRSVDDLGALRGSIDGASVRKYPSWAPLNDINSKEQFALATAKAEDLIDCFRIFPSMLVNSKDCLSFVNYTA